MRPLFTAASLLLALAGPRAVQAYELRRSDDGKVLIWDASVVKVEIDPSGVGPLGGVTDAVRAGFWAWTSAGLPIKVHFKEAKSALALAVDGTNAVLWQTTGWKYGKSVVAMTVSSYRKSTGFVTETDMVLNARDHTWALGAAGHYDVQNVVAHEAGHFFGMGHSTVQEATMYATTPAGETAKRSLAADDRAGIAALIEEINRRHMLPETKGDVGGETERNLETGDTELRERDGVGCSVPGRAGLCSSWPALALLLGLLAGRRRRGFGVLLLATAPLIALSTASATVTHRLTLGELHEESTTVVRARVVARRSHMEPGSGLIFTDHTLRVTRCFKPARCDAVVTVRTLGGEIGDRGLLVQGMPRLRTGREVILFGGGRADALVPVGLAQGVYHLEASGAAVRDLRGLDLLVGRKRTTGRIERVPTRALESRLSRFSRQPDQ